MMFGKPGSVGSDWDKTILRLFSTGLTNSYYLVFITSSLFSMFTPWGFLKHWWIIIKWILIWILFAAAWLWGGPSIGGMVSLIDSGLADPARTGLYYGLQNRARTFVLFIDILLLLMFFFSVYKPFGATGIKNGRKRKVASYIAGCLIIAATAAGFICEHRNTGYRSVPVSPVVFENVPDGAFYGEEEYGSFVYKVKVTVQNGRVADIRSVDSRESKYAFYAEGVFNKIIREQRIDVDAVAGATSTSRAYQEAVGNALVR